MMVQECTIDIGRLREKSLVMLKDVKKVLDEGGVRFWLNFGSLLGAVREGRSIPWDGDYDLSTLDEDIGGRIDLWDKLRRMGYIVKIRERVIKIEMASWAVGYYKIDLHQFLYTAQGETEYCYGEKFASKVAVFFQKLNEFIELSLPINNDYCPRTEFDRICRAIISCGISGNKLEGLGPIKYYHGDIRSEDDFCLENVCFKYTSNFFAKKSRKSRALIKLLQLLPVNIRLLIKKMLTRFLDRSKKIPLMKAYLASRFFNTLANVNFHGMIFKAPRFVEDYLGMVYGENWRKPQVKWGMSTDSPLNTCATER